MNLICRVAFGLNDLSSVSRCKSYILWVVLSHILGAESAGAVTASWADLNVAKAAQDVFDHQCIALIKKSGWLDRLFHASL